LSDIQPWQNPQTNPNKPSAATSYLLKRSWLRAWWPALVWAAFIFTMSTDTFSSEHTATLFEPLLRWLHPSFTKHQLHVIHFYIRKSAHFTEYFVFCLLLYRGVRGMRQGWRWTWGLAALSIAAGYSALDEIHQAFVASRGASAYDSLLDSAGAFFATAALWLWFRSRIANSSGLLSPSPQPSTPPNN
jgi:VanZ family protein